MEEKELKTSLKQRVVIIIIAVIMLGSIIASYAAIILNGGGSSTSGESTISEEKVLEYEEAYKSKLAEFQDATRDDFKKFVAYKSEVKAYNENSANSNGVQSRDIVKGSGNKLTEESKDYLVYYIGWCADGTIFDSSFDDSENPTAFGGILDVSLGMIEGWYFGMNGARIGGVREITIPGELAYGENMEICGGYNKPLKFVVMTKEKADPLKTLASELDTANMRYQYALYGIDYDAAE